MSWSASSRPTAIPPSPTSSPESGLKRRRLSDPHATSPKSPSFMSVATKSYVSSYGTTQHQSNDEMSSRASPRSPSGAATSSRPIQTHSLPTPAHSVTGMSSFDMTDDTDQHRDKRPRIGRVGNEEADQMEVEPVTQPTNHDRQDMMDTDGAMDASLNAESKVSSAPHETPGYGAVKESSSAGDETTLEQLQKDMGEAFLLCRSKVERQRPNPQQHLLALYGLGPLLRSVARTDPKTGEKINKLRKSYEGQIKNFRLLGRNKPVKAERNVEEDQPGPLRRMAGSSPWGLEPDEQWHAEHARSKIEVTVDFKAKMKQAMHMQPGTVRNNDHWEDVLGFDKPKPPPFGQPQPIPAPQPALSRVANGAAVRTQSQPVFGTAVTSELKRQTRGKKRSYGEDSFAGYGEGYSDGEEGDDGDDYGSQRKRKKVTLVAS